MKAICISVHHEGTFTYDPLSYVDGDVEVVENVDLGKTNYERLKEICKECCMFPVHEGVTEEVVNEELDDEIEMEDASEYVGLDHVDFGAKVDKPKSSSLRNGDDSSVDDRYKVKEGFLYPVHNPNLSWNEMAPLLGMKFEHPDQLKDCLINYRVANGYQLWYRRNDYRNISVLCGKNVKGGRCSSQKGKQKVVEDIGTPNSKSKKGTSKKSQSPKTPKSPIATPNADAAQKA
ncbi:hypothetical protein Tco_1290154, partial [Tanacetum coccineum]